MQCLVKVAAENKPEDKFELSTIENGLTVAKCVNAALMVNQPKEKEAFVSAIFVLVKRFCNLVNVNKNLNEDQMIELAVDLFERFKCESLEDVALFFKKARSGEFGEFHRLDSTIISKWIDLYLAQKSEAFEREMINQENIRRRKENDDVAAHEMNDYAKKKLQELSERLENTAKINTGVLKSENPLFNYDSYCDNLQLEVGKMEDGFLQTMLQNTSKRTHLKVWEILNTEVELRNVLEANKKINSSKTKKNSPK